MTKFLLALILKEMELVLFVALCWVLVGVSLQLFSSLTVIFQLSLI